MLFNLRFISSLFKYLVFLTSISIFLIFCDSNGSEYTGPWKEVPTPGGPESRLYACYFTSSDNGWACGNSWNEEEHRSYPLLIHWNGTEWEEYPYGGWFDEEGFKNIDLHDISFSSPDNGWCVGYFSKKEGGSFGFVLRYDGSKWYLFQNKIGVDIECVFSINNNDVWFALYPTWEEGCILYHFDGNEIKRCDTSPTDPQIFDIAFSSSNEGLAVGYYYSVYHWDGVSWTEIDSDPSRPFVNNAVSYYEPNSAIIVGEDRRARWRDYEYQYEYKFHADYRDIHFSHPDEGWMEGAEGGEGWTWHWDGKDWIKIEEPPDMGANAIFSVDYNDVWIVGWGKNNECWSWHYEK